LPDGSAGGAGKDAGTTPDGGIDASSRDVAVDVATRDITSADVSGEGSNGDDGPPNRKPCTTSFGSPDPAFGRSRRLFSAIIIPNQATATPTTTTSTADLDEQLDLPNCRERLFQPG
jgi:hypothetical protein